MNNINLKKINENNILILKNLFQLYIHDISKELPWDVDHNGLFETYSLNEWLKNKNNFGYLVYIDNNLVGFVMIDKEFKVLTKDEHSLNISEIFVLNNYKGKGIATAILNKIFSMYKAHWEIRPVPKNNSSHMFWQKFFLNNPCYIISKHEWKENRFAYTFSNL